MIPKRIIEKAVNAAEDNWIVIDQWQHDKTWAQVSAALHAVAGDIWATGYNFGSSDEITRALGIINDDQRTPNPYRQEHA